MERAAGILMPVSALPSPYGIGTLGAAARDYVNFLAAAGQKVWQILPLCPTSVGDSPYSSFSTCAGNPYFLDLDALCDRGLLSRQEVESLDWGSDGAWVDYGALWRHRLPLLRAAWEEQRRREGRAGLEEFARSAPWVEDYALFMALKVRFAMAPWTEWPEEIRLRRADAVERWRRELAEEENFYTWLQMEFYGQWDALRAYAREKGVAILGDLPMYVAGDSADVWAARDCFRLERDGTPTAVAGVPPDYFNVDGQLWGNPLYDWERMAEDGYAWWLRRMEGALERYDMVRIDHFRGFASYWSVPYGETTARNGRWEPGPGAALVERLRQRFAGRSIIAEDLGYLTPEVRELLRLSGFPGMKVLEFAFDAGGLSDYLPHRYEPGCVCYAGTHDNETLAQWLAAMSRADLDFAREYLGLNSREGYAWGVIRGGMASAAELFIAQMQDYLGLGAEGRMNVPGTAEGNWRWRMLPGQATPELAARLRRSAQIYGRL